MSNLYNASRYKNVIINLLLNSNDFVTLMNSPSPPHNQLEIQDMLLGGTWIIDKNKYEVQGQLFDHNFVDDTTVAEKTFVFVETDIDMIRQNIFTDDTAPSINEVEEMGYEVGHYGNRIDILCDIVDRILNGNKKLKGISDIEPAQRGFCTIYSPSNKYYGKCLKYNISNLNDLEEYCED